MIQLLIDTKTNVIKVELLFYFENVFYLHTDIIKGLLDPKLVSEVLNSVIFCRG